MQQLCPWSKAQGWDWSVSHLSSCFCQPTESFGGGTDGLAKLGQFAVLGILGDTSHGLSQHLQGMPHTDYGNCLPQCSQDQSSLCFIGRGGTTFPFVPISFSSPPSSSPNLHSGLTLEFSMTLSRQLK